MLRHTFLSIAGVTGLSGLFGGQTGTASPTTETDAQHDTGTSTETDLHESERTWRGEPADSSMFQAGIQLGDTFVRIMDASVGTQIGVLNDRAGVGHLNNGDIPDSEFDWYTPSDGEYIWLVEVDVADPAKRPPVDDWSLSRMTTEGQQYLSPFGATAEETPQHYRFENGLWGTQAAYTNSVPRNESRLLVFEHPAQSVDLFYGDPPEAAWRFSNY